MSWNDFALVKVEKLVSAEKWYTLSNGVSKFNPTQQNYNTYGNNPRKLDLDMKYRNRDVTILVRENRAGKLEVHLYTPWVKGIRKKRPNTEAECVQKILETYSTAIAEIDKEIEREEHQAAITKKLLERRDAIAKIIGLPVTTPTYDMNSFIYEASRKYGIAFKVSDNVTDEDLKTGLPIRITNIPGYFSVEQLLKLVDFLGECPQVMADRLTHGK